MLRNKKHILINFMCIIIFIIIILHTFGYPLQKPVALYGTYDCIKNEKIIFTISVNSESFAFIENQKTVIEGKVEKHDSYWTLKNDQIDDIITDVTQKGFTYYYKSPNYHEVCNFIKTSSMTTSYN